jgi:exo-1,4-beta-D-glucosaminidase
MKGKIHPFHAVWIAALTALIIAPAVLAAPADERMMLGSGWSMRTGAEVKDAGETIGAPGYNAAGWLAVTAPSTVLAGLVANGVYPDPYTGMNFAQIPGSWPKPLDMSSHAQPPGSPFLKPWWFRTEFDLADPAGRRVWLHFNGICFRANVWLNGKKIADQKDMAGVFRYFEYDVTEVVKPGKNALAIQLFPPHKDDLAFSWVDWAPAPPDRNLGLWREVFLTMSGPVALRNPQVETGLDLPSLDHARLTVRVQAKNGANTAANATLSGRIGAIAFSQAITLGPGETREIEFTPAAFSQLNIQDPQLWWPYQLGKPVLHDLSLELTVNGQVSDRLQTRFGIRKVTTEMTPEGHLLFSVNGRRILIRGGAWTPDLMFRWDYDRMDAELRYVKDMNLNALRMEGKLETDRFYERCDEAGILVLAGWCCCHHWERWTAWNAEDYVVAEASERTQIMRLRNHPCMLGWLNGSDKSAPADVEKMYLKVSTDAHWPNAVISSANDEVAAYSGPSGVKMTGPYEYVPPVYWYEDTKHGGAYGFNTETSPGPAVPPVESLKKMLGPDHLWPPDDVWNYHAGRGYFGNLNIFTKALNARYGPAANVEDFALKSQATAYEVERGMFEAYGRNKYISTGVIQWMMNEPWPKTIWHLYDYYLCPGGGYFGTRKALEPVHIQYSYDDRSAVILNSTYESHPGLRATAKVYDLEMKERFSQTQTADVGPDAVVRLFNVPQPDGISSTYFVKLDLTDPAGKLMSTNFYWLSTRPDVLNYPASAWYYTPTSTDADYSALGKLPRIGLEAKVLYEARGELGAAVVTLKNTTPTLAFLTHLKITKGKGGPELLPIFWEDNYFPLLPGESRTVRGEYRSADLAGAAPSLTVEGWNVNSAEY